MGRRGPEGRPPAADPRVPSGMRSRPTPVQTSLVLRPGVATRRCLFLHFFDLHFLLDRGSFARSDRAVAEMDLAVRFAVMLSSRILVPAASFYETEVAPSVLRPFLESDVGSLFTFVGSGGSLSEFQAEKLDQYRVGSLQHSVYSREIRQEAGWERRKRSATKDIASGWSATLQEEGLIASFSRHRPGAMTDAQFERAWLDVPERLGRDAFIVPHVLELLPLPAENLIVEGNLHRIINRNYFNSYAMDYSCAVFQRMSALGGDLVPSGCPGEDIDFVDLAKACRVAGVLEEIRRCPVGKLERLAFDSRFLEAFSMSQTAGSAESTGLDAGNSVRKKVDLAVLTALSKEMEAVEAVFGNGRTIGRRNDPHLYKWIELKVGTELKTIVVAAPSAIGNVRAAVTAMDLMRSFKPRYVVMVGIAGGCPNPCEPSDHFRLGDVVIGDSVLEYDHVKRTVDGRLEVRDSAQRIAYSWSQAVVHLRSEITGFSTDWVAWRDTALKLLHQNATDLPPDTLHASDGSCVPHPVDIRRDRTPVIVHVGGVAAGDTLLKDPILRDYLRDKHKIRAVEMESAGLRDASWSRSAEFAVVRRIVE
jgi:nucleoside phosphorylase